MIAPANAARIKDIASIDGVRENQLIGFGLVGGLLGTGDDPKNALYTAEAISGMLSQFGFHIAPESINIKNFAAVAITANMPAYYKPGDRLDATISSIGSAKSLEGGILYRTLLIGHDQNVYAVAQGPVSLGDFIGQSGGRGAKKHSTVGRIIGGAIVERAIPSTVLKDDGTIQINLHNPDFTTAQNISLELQRLFGMGIAIAVDGGTIRIRVPEIYKNDLVPFIAALESLNVQGDAPAKVIINERTGTVVMGGDVQILPVAVAHGNLSITVGPAGRIVGTYEEGGVPVSAQVQVGEGSAEGQAVIEQKETFVRVSAEDIVEGLNALGVAPSDIVAIFQAISAAGALQGALEII